MSEKKSSSSALLTIEELHNDVEIYKKQDSVNYLLNQPPPQAWVQNHPIIKKEVINESGQRVKVPFEYLPIDKVEYLLRNVIREYKIEILRENVFFNGVSVTVRVHYKDLVTGEWRYHDGIAGEQLQTNKGKSPADLNEIRHGAIAMALPIAKTNAIKDACDHFGNLFGANLNRNGVLPQQITASNDDMLEEIKLCLIDPSIILPDDERMGIERIVDKKEAISYKKALRVLKQFKNLNNDGE